MSKVSIQLKDKESFNSQRSNRNSSVVTPGTITDSVNNHSSTIFSLIGTNDGEMLQAHLNKYKSEINLIDMKDARQFTTLAYSCYKNSESCFMALYNHALTYNLSKEQGFSFEAKKNLLSKWANVVTDEEFSPLHFATYHGNVQLIKFLMENCEADMHKRNKFGSTVLHIAAQGD